jgi:LacI family transcriptional regulator
VETRLAVSHPQAAKNSNGSCEDFLPGQHSTGRREIAIFAFASNFFDFLTGVCWSFLLECASDLCVCDNVNSGVGWGSVAPRGSTRSFPLALVLPTEYEYARDVLRGIIAATHEDNYYASLQGAKRFRKKPLWLFRIYRGATCRSVDDLRRYFNDWNPEGVICQIWDTALAEFYRELGVPVVQVFGGATHSDFGRLLPDDFAAGRLAARHFLERGFWHFGFVGSGGRSDSNDREAGFKAEIERDYAEREKSREARRTRFTYSRYDTDTEAGIPDRQHESRHHARARGSWLTSLPKPLAVFAANDSWGFEMVQTARELKLHVPDDVAILGVDDDELLCEIVHPPLSSIRLGAEDIGRTAMQLLAQRMLGKKARGNAASVPPVGVVTRQSTDVVAVKDAGIAAAIRHIREHAAEGISVKQLLETIPVSRRMLERRFISVLGRTPSEEIRRVRAERIKTLLKTDRSIYEIARSTGFTTQEYLATHFLRETGMTPTEYRNQFRATDRPKRISPDFTRITAIMSPFA